MKELQRLWRDFDRSTAKQGRPFDLAVCHDKWFAYERAMCAHYGWSEWIGPRPIGVD